MDITDVDLELGNDPIQSYLLHKLKEIQLVNKDLQNQIIRRKELRAEYHGKIQKEINQNILKISQIWQKTFQGKWIIGIELKNNDESGIAENVNITFHWNGPDFFTYDTNCFSNFKQSSTKEKVPEFVTAITKRLETTSDDKNNFIENEYVRTFNINKSATIVVTFSIPAFAERQIYELDGLLTYEYNSKKLNCIVPTIEISSQTIIDPDFALKKSDIVSGDEKSFLTILSANHGIHLIAEYESKNHSLEKCLEFDCRFNKINIASKKRSVFLVDCLSEVLNNTVVVLEGHDDGLYDFIIYAQDDKMCQLLLHHVYKLIPGILILPRSYRRLLAMDRELKSLMNAEGGTGPGFQAKLKTVVQCMEAEIFLLEKYCNKKLHEIPLEELKTVEDIKMNNNVEAYRNFRMQLSDMEEKTDLHIQAIRSLMEKLNIADVNDANN
ncbi:hypothetical protein FQR65_LT04266 [Abscondita terminalis]|nr:hypothetical protein FQR65_LT04266 [Abscondita terminalis]